MNIWENILETIRVVLNTEIPVRTFAPDHDLVRCKSNPNIVVRRADEPDGLSLDPGPNYRDSVYMRNGPRRAGMIMAAARA